MSDETPAPVELDELRRLAEAAVERAPGRWFWAGTLGRAENYGRNAVALRLSCMRPGWGQTTVMDFMRAGMAGAVPRFLGPAVGLEDARDVAVYERRYRDEVCGIDNPLAAYIAAANPATILALLGELESLRSEVERLRGDNEQIRDEMREVSGHAREASAMARDLEREAIDAWRATRP